MAAHQCATRRLCGVLRQLQPRTAPCAGPGDELVPEARAIKLSNDDMELLRAATLATGLASLSSAPFDVSLAHPFDRLSTRSDRPCLFLTSFARA